MTRRLLPGFLLGILALLGWWILASDKEVFLHGEDSVVQGGHQGAAATESDSADASENSADLDSGASGLQRETLLEAASMVEHPGVMGTVSWMDGKPSAGVEVLLLHEDSGDLLQATRTDEEGRYSLTVPVDAEHEELDMYQVLCLGFAAEENYYTAMPQIPADRVDIKLSPGFALQVVTTFVHDGSPAPGIFLTAYDENDGDAEVLALTDAHGIAELHMPQEGAWNVYATIGGFVGPDASLFRTEWIDAQTGHLEISIAPHSDAVSLQAVDAATGMPIKEAVFRMASAPNDLRDIEPLGLAVLPSNWGASNGRLDLQFVKSGRAFLRIDAPGYLPEVVEWIGNDGRTHEIPMLPMRSVPVRITEHGEPVQAQITTAVNQRAMVLPAGEFYEEVASRPHTGGLRPQGSDANGNLSLQLPDPDIPGAPQDFDLWMQVDGSRKYFGTLSWNRLPEPPWHFEMAPPVGEVVLHVSNQEGEPLEGLSFHISAEFNRKAFDSIRMGQFGTQSLILKTDLHGRAVVKMPAPANIHVVGTGFQGTEEVDWVGRLEAEQTLTLPIQVSRPSSSEDLISTFGRIEMPGQDSTLSKRNFWVRIHPLDSELDSLSFPRALPVRDDLTFRLATPQGRFVIWCSAEPLSSAEAAGRTTTFRAGENGVILRLPTPHGLKVQAIDAVSGMPVLLKEAVIRSSVGRDIELESWEGDFALSYTVFDDEVEVQLEAEGFVPAFSRVTLQDGRLTETTVPMTRSRSLPIRILPTQKVEKELLLQWVDAPGAKAPYRFDARTWVWGNAPRGTAHLRAYLNGQPLHDIHLDEESTEIVIDLGASQFFTSENE